MTEPILDFVGEFGARLRLDEDCILKKEGKYFLIDPRMREGIFGDFFYAGAYLGKQRKARFFPSLELLRMIAETEANKITVDEKTEWLFICQRDVFKQGIKRTVGSTRKGAHVLVLNSFGECLGFGRFTVDFDQAKSGVVVENILDVGDFLRREDRAH